MEEFEFKNGTRIHIPKIPENKPNRRGLNIDSAWHNEFGQRLDYWEDLKNQYSHEEFHNEIYGGFNPLQCSVKSISGEKRCPEEGTIKIARTDDWICKSCFKAFQSEVEVKEVEVKKNQLGIISIL